MNIESNQKNHHAGHHHHHAGHHHDSKLLTSAFATLHCLIGCVIGEVAGLFIGTALGFGVWQTVFLAVVLAYVSGMTLGVIPVMQRESLGVLPALKVVWIGEAVSIAVMEIVMNGVDLWVGGIQSGSLTSMLFWVGLGLAVPAAFIATWPVNHWLLKKQLKACH